MIPFLPCLVLWFLPGLIEGAYYQEPAMWNVLAGKSLSINPSDAGCDPKVSATFCVPDVFGIRSSASSMQCLPRLCTQQNSSPAAMTDGNLTTSFITKNLQNRSLEITADLNGTFNVFYLRLAFSGNPPTSIILQRRIDTLGRNWMVWRYFAVDCSLAFGVDRYQPPPAGELITNTIQCSPLPWTSTQLSPVNSSLIWNVLQDRPDIISDQTDATVLDQLTSVSDIRIILSGHLLSLPDSGTTYGGNSYGISEIAIYGRCATGFHRSAENTTTCEACGCNREGSINQTCTSQGTCSCKPNFISAKCTSCSGGFFNVSAGCPQCNCDDLGTIGNVCDNETGACQCRNGFTGQRCSDCRTGSYLLGHVCVPCECNIPGSLAGLCDRNGSCTCKLFVTGVRCDVCLDGFVELAERNPNGCRLRVLFVDSGQNHTLHDREVIINSTEFNHSTIAAVVFTSPTGSGQTLANTLVDGSVVYPWLIAITVLLVIALLIALVHFVFYIRRRSWQKTYSPRQVPEFLSVETTAQHPDYAFRRPQRPSTKLTGYFYNPEYPLGALTPGSRGRRGTDTNRNSGEYNVNAGYDEDDDDGDRVNNTQPPAGRRPIDLSREPAVTGVLPFRPHGQSSQRTSDNRPIATISGGIVNQNFTIEPEEII